MAIIITLFTIILLSNILCQHQEYIFSNITRNANLSQHFITSIIEDDNGIMWFGTQDGLNYYDGYNFHRYSFNPNNKNSISSNFITALTKDNSGNLWIGTSDGLNKLDLKTETFTVFEKDNYNYSLGDDYIVDLEFDKKSNIYIATKYDGLYKLDLKSIKFNKILRNYPKINFNFLEDIHKIEIDIDGNLWIIYNGKGLVYYNTQTKNIKIFSNSSTEYKIPNNLVTSLTFLGNDVIVGLRNFGLFAIDKNNFKIKLNIIKDKKYKNFVRSTKTINSNAIITLKNRTIIFDNLYSGLLKYDFENNNFQLSSEFIHNIQDSLDKYVYTLYLDSKDNIWIGSAGFGIGIISKNHKSFINYSYKMNNAKFRLTFPSIRSIYEDNRGDLYVGGYNGLNKIDKELGVTDVITNEAVYLINKDIFGSEDYLTVSFESYQYGGTLYRFNKRYKTFKPIFQNVKNTFVRCYLKDSQSELWIGMMNGLYKYNFRTSELTLIKNNGVDFSKETISQIYEDEYKNIWVSTIGKGIFIFNRQSNNWTNIRKNKRNSNNISSNHIYGVFKDSKKRLWICTNSGLNLYNPINNTFKVFNENDGLPNNVVYSIIEDNQGYLWLSTNLGISRFDYDKKEFWNFDERDGVTCNEKNFNAAHKGKSGMIYFGGISGLTCFEPTKFKKNLNDLKVLLIKAKIIPDKEQKNKLYYAYTNELELYPEQKTLILEFTIISDYSSSRKSQYRFKISDNNEDWINVGFNREITLANLPHGVYKLLVSASNNDGVWTKKPLELSIIVKPKFWQTTWFLIITIMIGIILIIGFIIMRIQFLKRTNIKLEKIVKERTRELEASKMELELANSTKNRFFSIVAHDLKNPFNALINYSYILLTDYKELSDDEKIQFIKGIKDSSESTYKFLQNLLIWARTQSNSIKCIPKEVNIKFVIDEAFRFLNVQANEKNIRLLSSIENDTFVFADENMLNTIFINLLTNAIKYSYEGKSVFVDIVEITDDFIKISVRDEGIGINDEVKKKLFHIEHSYSIKGTKGETGTGLGLIITNEFIKANKGKIEVESKLGAGTTFYVTLPTPKNILEK